ncbi:MAG: A/G-specific adenine glycosylase [Parasphingorhabdus sp.]
MAVDSLAAKARNISTNISAHYVDNARKLPWRVPPAESRRGKLPDPYHVWLSEIMLQQTTVGAVKSYFEKFVQRWPSVHDLADAEEVDVLAAWAGLGYYARARNLHKCALQVSRNYKGIFPQEESELLQLPGVGAYTAAAIAAIAFGERAVVVDANIERLVARLYAIDTPLPKGKSKIRTKMDLLTPSERAGDFAQACMDIGASICTARKPKCEICPVSLDCKAKAIRMSENFPVKPPKKEKPIRKARFFWVEDSEKLLLSIRPDKGMLAGMRCIPDDNWSARQDGNTVTPIARDWKIFNNAIQHSFTHFSLEIDLAVYRGEKIVTNNDDNIWWPLEQIEQAGLPTLYAKAVRWMAKKKQEDDK